MTPNCVECLRKHLAAALAIGAEVHNGHSAGGHPDHRIDFSGELIEAEKHASLLDKTLSLKIRFLRRSLQGQRWKPVEADLEVIRTFWHVSFAIGGESELYNLKVNDKELYDAIMERLKLYSSYDAAEDQSDVVRDCQCAASEKLAGKGRATSFPSDFGNSVSIIYCSDCAIPSPISASMVAMVSGLERRITVPASFEKWPKAFFDRIPGLGESSNTMLCLWPEGVDILRKTNVLAIPSVLSEKNALSVSDETYIKLKLRKTPRSFERLPIYVGRDMLIELCEDYERATSSTEIGDIYSLIRNFDNAPVFKNVNFLVVRDIKDIKEKTLFVVP